MRTLRGAWTTLADVFTAVPGDPPPRLPLAADDAGTFGARLNAHLVRRPGRLVAACLATVIGPAVVTQAGAMPVQPVAEVRPGLDAPLDRPSAPPVAGDLGTWVPVAVQAAATCPGLPAPVLLAIAQVESNLGLQPWTSAAGAQGPMQFLTATWAHYGADGDGDGVADIMNPLDAMHGAARLLCANGGADPERLPSAVWNYNHSDDYVRRVLALSRMLPV